MDSSQITDFESAAAYVRESGHSAIKLAVTDIDGILRGKYVSRDKFLSALEKGLGFCDVIFGWDSNDELYGEDSYTGWHTAFPDAWARIDPTSCRLLPTEDNLSVLFLAVSNVIGWSNGPAGNATTDQQSECNDPPFEDS